MPNPKKHHTHSRTRMRRGNWTIAPQLNSRCPQCGVSKPPHRICPECGYYKNEPWIVKQSKSSETEQK